MGTEGALRGFRGYRWRPWKLALIVIGGLLLAVGLITGGLAARDEAPDDTAPDDTAPATLRERDFGGNSFGSTGSPGSTGSTTGLPAEPVAATESEVPWSSALFGGGISFFAAFVLAFAFRSFLRIAMFFLGIWVASLFLLSHLGWLEIHWGIINDQFVLLTSRLGEQFKSISSFVTGSLPKAGLAGLGLLAGFKKG